VLAVVAVTAGSARAGEFIKKDDLLTVNKCVDIALKNHPSVIAAFGSVSAGISKMEQARAGYYPELGATSGYAKKSPVTQTTQTAARTTVASNNSTDEYHATLSLKQTIYDFGKISGQVEVQRFGLDASRSDLENARALIVFGVRQAYYTLLQATRNLATVNEAIKQAETHLAQAKGFFEAGSKPKFDVTKALVDVSNAKLNQLKAVSAMKTARINLNNAIGAPDAPEYRIEDNLSFSKFDITFEAALETAYRTRNDLKSLSAKQRSAEEALSVAKKGYYPVLDGNASYGLSGQRFPLDDNWTFGATVTIPIFSGFLTKHQVEESRASLDITRANRDLLRQSVYLEVQQAYLNLRDAEERVPVAEIVVRQTEDNRELAVERYKAGIGNSVEVADAELQYVTANTNYTQALYDYRVAEASLLKAMGAR
jgi:outer membrane protein TolC